MDINTLPGISAHRYDQGQNLACQIQGFLGHFCVAGLLGLLNGPPLPYVTQRAHSARRRPGPQPEGRHDPNPALCHGGAIAPELVVTPGIFVDRVIKGERYEVRFK